MTFFSQENNKQQTKSRFTSPKAVSRKSKTRINKTKQDLTDVHKGEIISDDKPVTITEPQQPQIQLAQMQQQSLGKMVIIKLSVRRHYVIHVNYFAILIV